MEEFDAILIGGTGQRFGVVLGWLGLMGLAQVPRRTLVLDAEGTVYDSETSDTLRELFQFAQRKQIFFRFSPPYDTGAVAGAGRDAYGAGVQNADAVPAKAAIGNPTSDLWKLCFTEHEAELDIHTGFMANPKVASSVFSAFALKDDVGNIVKNFIPDDGQQKPLLIVGSLAGGTGAGLMYAVGMQCRETMGSSQNHPIMGIAFSNYLDLGDQAKNDRLKQNAQFGAEFLYGKWIDSSGADYPFDLLTLMGPPESAPNLVSPSQSGIHEFPGFLVAAHLVHDGCQGLKEKVAPDFNGQGNNGVRQGMRRTFGISFVGVRNEENIYVRGHDLAFECPSHLKLGTSAKICLDDFESYITEIDIALKELRDFPWDAAVSGASLFPRHKISEIVWSAAANLGNRKQMDVRNLQRLVEKLVGRQENKGQIDKYLEHLNGQRPGLTFMKWFQGLKSNGLAVDNHADSTAVKYKPWRKSLSPDTSAEGAEIQVEEFLTQTWIRSTATGLLTDSSPAKPQGGSYTYAFPDVANATPPPGNIDDKNGVASHLHSMATIAEDGGCIRGIQPALLEAAATGSCFPTPLGRAWYVRRMLEACLATNDDVHPLWQEIKTLWQALGAGFLTIDPLSISSTPAKFEKVINKLEPNLTHVGILRVTDKLPSHTGIAIGAIDPIFGIWSGLNFSNTDQTISDVVTLLNQSFINTPGIGETALGALRRWILDIQTTQGFDAQNQPLWMKVVDSITKNIKPQDYNNLGTTGPVKLFVPGVASKPIYVYRYESYRAVARQNIVSGLQNKSLVLTNPRGQVDDFEVVDRTTQQPRVVATIRGRLIWDQTINIPESILRGCLHVHFNGILGQVPTPNSVSPDFLGTDLTPVANYLRQGAGMKRVYLPEILWS